MTNDLGQENELLEQRLVHVEAALGLKAPSLEDRLESIETRLETLNIGNAPNPWLTALDYTIKIVSALTPVVLLVVGFMIKGSVELVIHQRELGIKEARLKLDEAQALDGLLKNFRKSNIGMDEARTTALLILDFGNAGIRPLVQDLDVGEQKVIRANASAHALKIHAVMGDEHDEVCLLLQRIDDTQPPIFGHVGLQRVSDLGQELGCKAFD